MPARECYPQSGTVLKADCTEKTQEEHSGCLNPKKGEERTNDKKRTVFRKPLCCLHSFCKCFYGVECKINFRTRAHVGVCVTTSVIRFVVVLFSSMVCLLWLRGHRVLNRVIEHHWGRWWDGARGHTWTRHVLWWLHSQDWATGSWRKGLVIGLLLLPKISNLDKLLAHAMIILGSTDEAGLPESTRAVVYATEKQTNSQRGFGKWV